MATILSNFQQKFALGRSFQQFAIEFLRTKNITRTLEERFEIFVKLAKKCDVFLLKLYLAIDPSNLASEMMLASSQSSR